VLVIYDFDCIAISVITRTGYNEQIRLDLGARYIRFLLYFCEMKIRQKKEKTNRLRRCSNFSHRMKHDCISSEIYVTEKLMSSEKVESDIKKFVILFSATLHLLGKAKK